MEYILNKGQTLFEVIVAIGLSAMILVGVVALSTMSLSNSTATKDNAVANKYAQECTEWVRQERDSDWTNISGGLNGCLGKDANNKPSYSGGGCSANLDSFYTRKVVVTVSGDEAHVNCTVSWQEGNKSAGIVAETVLTNWHQY